MQSCPQHACPRLMGIVNVTPDSFSDGGRFVAQGAAIDHAMTLVDEGADILDIGGESTRPGAREVALSEEQDRVLPVIEGLAKRTSVPLSIDTRKPSIAVDAVAAGASLWNDVSALTYSPDSLSVAGRLECDIVLMHAQGTPQVMQENPSYDDVVTEVSTWLGARVHAAMQAGVSRDRLILDPGIGFGKTLGHNMVLLGDLDRFHDHGLPILVGASRKRFIAELDRDGQADTRIGGSIAVALLAAQKGVHILRVHDVAQTRQALTIALKLGMEA